MPDIYQQFVRDIPGSRRFLLKWGSQCFLNQKANV
jgi:hypothetical protein